jgi:hypothetical protein
MGRQTRPDDPVVRTYLALRQSMWTAVEAHRDRQSMISISDAVRDLLRTALRTVEEERKRVERADRAA